MTNTERTPMRNQWLKLNKDKIQETLESVSLSRSYVQSIRAKSSKTFIPINEPQLLVSLINNFVVTDVVCGPDLLPFFESELIQGIKLERKGKEDYEQINLYSWKGTKRFWTDALYPLNEVIVFDHQSLKGTIIKLK